MSEEKINNDFERYNQIVDYFNKNSDRLIPENKSYLNDVRSSLFLIAVKGGVKLNKKVLALQSKLNGWLENELVLVFEEKGEQK